MKLALAAVISVLAIVSTTMGIASLRSKPTTHDEAYTRLWVSGHSRVDVYQAFSNDLPIEAANLTRLMSRDAHSFSFKEMIKNTYLEGRDHPPGYLFILTTWQRIFGESLFTDRLLSALMRPLGIALLGWLAFEIFDSWLAAFFTGALLLVSPFELRLSLVARDYTLLLAAFSFSAASLQAYLKRPSRVYFLCFLFGSFLLVNISLLGVLILVFLVQKTPGSAKSPLQLGVIPCVCFLIWVLPQMGWVVHGVGPAISAEGSSFGYLCQSVGKNVVQIFFDLNDVSLLIRPLSLPIVALIFTLAGLAIAYAWKDPKKGARVLLAIALFNFLPYFLADSFYGSTYYTSDRHLVLAHTVLILLVARLIQVWAQSLNLKIRSLGIASIAILVLIGAVSFRVVTAADNWQQKTISHDNKEIVQRLNSDSNPFLITDLEGTHLGNILAMSAELKPQVHIVLERDYSLKNLKRSKNENAHFFYFDPSLEARKNIAAMGLQLSPIENQPSLWKLE